MPRNAFFVLLCNAFYRSPCSAPEQSPQHILLRGQQLQRLTCFFIYMGTYHKERPESLRGREDQSEIARATESCQLASAQLHEDGVL
eukprot:3443889-Pleurochrysis_carterae.AAC.1